MKTQGSRLSPAARRALAVALLGAVGLTACASPGPARVGMGAGAPRVRAYNRPYEVHGRWYTPADQPGYDAVGMASWYSYESHNRTTADGEPFDATLATAAHTTLPIPSYLDVTNLENGRRVRVRLNDRGPFAAGRIIDLSRGAAQALGFLGKGTAKVRVRYVGPAPPFPGGARMTARVASRADAADPRTIAPEGLDLESLAAQGPAPQTSTAQTVAGDY